MFAHHLFLLGISVQLLVACAGGSLLFWLSRTVRRIAEAVRSLPDLPAAVRPVLRPAAVTVSSAAARAAVPIRGPPRS
jgi:hypothetical protein